MNDTIDILYHGSCCKSQQPK